MYYLVGWLFSTGFDLFLLFLIIMSTITYYQRSISQSVKVTLPDIVIYPDIDFFKKDEFWELLCICYYYELPKKCFY